MRDFYWICEIMENLAKCQFLAKIVQRVKVNVMPTAGDSLIRNLALVGESRPTCTLRKVPRYLPVGLHQLLFEESIYRNTRLDSLSGSLRTS